MNNSRLNSAFFQNHSKQMSKLDDLISKSNAALMCGPTCQKIKKTEELEKKYIDAQTNLISAPDQLMSAQKKFILFSQGIASYNTKIERDLTDKARRIASTLQSEFDQNIQNAENLTDTYGTMEGNDEYMQDLKNKYILENAKLSLEIKDTFNDIVTNDRKTYYQDQNMTRVYAWYNLYIVIYVILMILFLIFIFLVDSKYSLKIKIIFFIIFCGYPWFSKPLVGWLIGLGQHISDLLPKNIYKSL